MALAEVMVTFPFDSVINCDYAHACTVAFFGMGPMTIHSSRAKADSPLPLLVGKAQTKCRHSGQKCHCCRFVTAPYSHTMRHWSPNILQAHLMPSSYRIEEIPARFTGQNRHLSLHCVDPVCVRRDICD
jgi:hypothetical protein